MGMGKLTVAGIGPGSLQEMTPRVRRAIEEAAVVVGYDTYIQLIASLLSDKEVIGTGMMQEVERCRMAVEAAVHGSNTVIVSSGDAGVYGMAGLVLELVQKLEQDAQPAVEVLAGVSAVHAAAAVLGAPLMHDFAVISLSDLMTPWETICQRVEMAAQGDFVIALYNPKSRTRVQNIEEVRTILLRYKSPDTPVGIVNQASRAGETRVLSNLHDFTKEEIHMLSLVIIGNRATYIRDGWMITPRGYTL